MSSKKGEFSAHKRALHRPPVVGLATNAWPVRRTQAAPKLG
ncbi:MAG: hypothetical protein U0350_46810 [Caldilineaceae bacterium]